MKTESEQLAAERARIRRRERRRAYRRFSRPPWWTIIYGSLAAISFVIAYCVPHVKG